MNSTQPTFEEIIEKKRADLLVQREVIAHKEKEFEEDSIMKLCYNSQASLMLDLSAQLQWVLKTYKDCKDAELFPNCLDAIMPESKYEAGDHGV